MSFNWLLFEDMKILILYPMTLQHLLSFVTVSSINLPDFPDKQ